jgi:hypothetical protein
MMGNEVVTTNSTIRFGRAPLYVQSDSLSIATMRSAIQTASLTTEADTTPPNVSIDEFPTRGTSQGITSFRWLGIDETSVPSATEPSSVVYSFKLEGKDADWSAWTPRTHVQYTALSSGNYTFQVRGKDFSGNTSSIESRAFSVGTSPKPSPPSGLIIIQ